MQGKGSLSVWLGRNGSVTEVALFPAHAGFEEELIGLLGGLGEGAKLEFERLNDQHDGLIEQHRKIGADHGMLAQRAHDGLLHGTIEEVLLEFVALLRTFFERFGHFIEQTGKLPEFAALMAETGPAGEIACCQAGSRLVETTDLAEDETFD